MPVLHDHPTPEGPSAADVALRLFRKVLGVAATAAVLTSLLPRVMVRAVLSLARRGSGRVSSHDRWTEADDPLAPGRPSAPPSATQPANEQNRPDPTAPRSQPARPQRPPAR